ncbi:MAG TPA: chemotaxis protein CheB [Rhodanobacter sp.]|nr:chemotaxis protein CheB [Rhodanobacter sp.]
MTDTPPAVALLFDDTELAAHLRDALHERGARIVHEGGLSGISRELLEQVGADVLVVNLDDGADDALDHLYEVIDGDRPRVVFNDAQASRSLDGWDRARWARHLAVKVLAAGDIDPPRPTDAREIQSPAVAPVPPAAMPVETETSHQVAFEESAETETLLLQPAMVAASATEIVEPVEALAPQPDPDWAGEQGFPAFDEDAHAQPEQEFPSSSEDLAAELEALLALGDLPGEEHAEAAEPGLRFSADEEPPALFDGNFGAPDAAEPDVADTSPEPVDKPMPETPTPTFQTDYLQLSELTEGLVASEPAAEPNSAPAPAVVSAPDGWALVDDNAPAKSGDELNAASFGIEKISAADFLAPDVEAVSPDVEATMSLELVSLEESVAPQAFVPDHEMLLDDLHSALSRVVLLGAGVDAIDSVGVFLAALPASTRLTFVLTQHLGSRSDEALLGTFASQCALPVQLADAGRRATAGEVLMVPAGQQIRLRRDGNVELLARGEHDAKDPSIDASLTMGANVFGRDALAIVFAGGGNDAVAGAQAIHDRGGQVWVESSSGEHFADMVSGIFAERLVSYSGTPSELAAHLLEVFP